MNDRTRPDPALNTQDRAVLLDRQRRARSSAFSLLELIIVLVILGTIASLASVRYAGAASTYRIEAAASRLAADLRQARQRALARSSEVFVTFDTTDESYQVRTREEIANGDEGSTQSLTGAIQVQLDDEPYRVSISRLNVTGGRPEVVFNAFGTADSDMTVELKTGDRKRTVTLVGATGVVSISP